MTGTLHESQSVVHIVGSDLCRATVQGTHFCASLLLWQRFQYLLHVGQRLTSVSNTRITQFALPSWRQWLRERVTIIRTLSNFFTIFVSVIYCLFVFFYFIIILLLYFPFCTLFLSCFIILLLSEFVSYILLLPRFIFSFSLLFFSSVSFLFIRFVTSPLVRLFLCFLPSFLSYFISLFLAFLVCSLFLHFFAFHHICLFLTFLKYTYVLVSHFLPFIYPYIPLFPRLFFIFCFVRNVLFYAVTVFANIPLTRPFGC